MDKDIARKLAAAAANHEQEYAITNHEDDTDTLTIPVRKICGKVRE